MRKTVLLLGILSSLAGVAIADPPIPFFSGRLPNVEAPTSQPSGHSSCLAKLKGVGPHADEWIVVAAENVTDDQSAAQKMLADAATALAAGPAPQRSILIVAFSGFDHGVGGADELLGNSPVPMTQIASVIILGQFPVVIGPQMQFDYNLTSSSLTPLIAAASAGEHPEFSVVPNPDAGRNAATSFMQMAIPTLRISGQTIDQSEYSPDTQPSATQPASIDPKVVGAVAARVAIAMASAPEWSLAVRGDRIIPRVSEAPRRSVWLGIVPNQAASDSTNGVCVSGVLPKSPAAAAGVQNGDVIVGCDDKPITGLDDLNLCLLAAKPNQVLTLRMLRGQAQVTMRITLAEPPK